MYESIPVKPLSTTQQRNLVNGRGVRISHDPSSRFKIDMSPQQIKKLASAYRKGKGMTITLDPYQQDITGKGIFGDKFDKFGKKLIGEQLYNKIGEMGKPLLQKAISAGSKALGAYISPAAAQRLETAAQSYVNDPRKYQSKEGLLKLAQGQGILGKKVDQRLKKMIGQKGIDRVNMQGRELLDKGINRASKAMSKAGVSQEYIDRAESAAHRYINDPSQYQSKEGLMRLAQGQGVRRIQTKRGRPRGLKGGALYPAGY